MGISVRIPTITCPYCRYIFKGVSVAKHGTIRCGNCGKAMRV